MLVRALLPSLILSEMTTAPSKMTTLEFQRIRYPADHRMAPHVLSLIHI